jgi:two-component system cell cycle response regulator CtrA
MSHDRDLDRVLAENSELRQQIDRLNEVVLTMRMAIGDNYEFAPAHLPPLTGSEWAVLRLLTAKGKVRRAQIWNYLYSDRLDGPDEKIIDVYISKLRRKLTPVGIEIVTLWGIGYAMPESSRDMVRQGPTAAAVGG